MAAIPRPARRSGGLGLLRGWAPAMLRAVRDPAPRGLLAPALRRTRHQMLFVAVAAIFLPALVAEILLDQSLAASPRVGVSLVFSGLAALLALVVYRQTCDFPGIRQTEQVIPALALAYGLVFALLLALRVDYSRIVLFSGLGFVLVGMSGALLLGQQRDLAGSFWLVPFGKVDRLRRLVAFDWRDLSEPRVPQGRQQAIVVDLRAALPEPWEQMISRAVLAGIPVYHIKQLEEALTGRVDIEHLSENTLGALGTSQTFASIKRLGDVSLAIVLLPVMMLLFAALGVLIRLDSPGPVFFVQERAGFRGERFRMVKLRTMTALAPALAGCQIPGGNAERAAAITRADDQRITRVGRFLRHYRLDELPQIFNVLSGEMSWIGPRPEAIELSRWYGQNLPFYSYRHIVRPGITGWAQVSQGHVADLASVHDKLRFDFFYIKNFSLWLDLVIAARTIRVICSGFGSK